MSRTPRFGSIAAVALWSGIYTVLGSRLKPGCAEDAIVAAALELLSESTR